MTENNITDSIDLERSQILQAAHNGSKPVILKKTKKSTKISKQSKQSEQSNVENKQKELQKELQKSKETAELYKFMYEEQVELIKNLNGQIKTLTEENEKLKNQISQKNVILDLSGEPIEPAQIRKILIENNNLRTKITSYEKQIKTLNDRINLVGTVNSKSYGF